jgi:asparagine synthetase B (glutamine-hydrolysing)
MWQGAGVARRKERPEVPESWVRRIDALLLGFPKTESEPAWVGWRWRVAGATIAHVFGGEDGLFRITFRGEPGEVMAFTHLGLPYFRAEWGDNVIGMLLDDDTDWTEVAELLTDSYCIVAPETLAAQVPRPT